LTTKKHNGFGPEFGRKIDFFPISGPLLLSEALGAILYKNESLKLSLNTKSNLGEEKSGNSYFCTILRLLVVEIQQIRLHKVRTQYDRFLIFVHLPEKCLKNGVCGRNIAIASS
jgi:hypothetical protein